MTTDPTRLIEIYAINAAGNLRWITNVTPLRVPYGRYEIFVQKDVVARLPIATTGGVIPIVDNHLGVDFGAPRQIYVHMRKRRRSSRGATTSSPFPASAAASRFPAARRSTELRFQPPIS